MATKITTDGAVTTGSLQDQLRKHIQETGGISSAALAQTLQQEPEPTPSGAAMSEPTVVDGKAANPQAGMDPVVVAAEKGASPAKVAAGVAADASVASTNELLQLMGQRKKMVIAPETKQAFLTAIINNERFAIPYNLCGGKLRIVIRSRMIPETQAIIALQRREIDQKVITTNMDYKVRSQAMLMVAQVQEINGRVYPIMAQPYYYQAQPNGPDLPPGWLEWVDHFVKQHEGMASMIWTCLQDFENQYWFMIEEATKQDFWSPAASTSV